MRKKRIRVEPVPDVIALRNLIQQRINEARRVLIGWRVRLQRGKLLARFATIRSVCVQGDQLYVMLEDVQALAGGNQYLDNDHPLVAGKTFRVDDLQFVRRVKS